MAKTLADLTPTQLASLKKANPGLTDHQLVDVLNNITTDKALLTVYPRTLADIPESMLTDMQTKNPTHTPMQHLESARAYAIALGIPPVYVMVYPPAKPVETPAEKTARVLKSFIVRPLQVGQAERYTQLLGSMHGVASSIMQHCPDSKEMDLALIKLEEAKMWACAAINNNE